MRKSVVLAIILSIVVLNVSPAIAESERRTPSHPYFETASEEYAVLFAFSFLQSYFSSRAGEAFLGPDEEPLTEKDIRNIDLYYKFYFRGVLGRLFDLLRERGVDVDNLSSLFDLFSALLNAADKNGDGVLTLGEAKDIVYALLPFGVTRGMIIDALDANKVEQEMIPEILKNLRQALHNDGFLKQVIQQLCQAGILLPPLCDLPALPECNDTGTRANGELDFECSATR